MIFDAHTHAYRAWPYVPPYSEPPPPWPTMAGRAEMLLFEMDRNGVDGALLIGANNVRDDGNNGYIRELAVQHPRRLFAIADVSVSSDAPAAHSEIPERVRDLADGFIGFTYRALPDGDCEWLLQETGHEVLELAAERRYVLSLAIPPRAYPNLRRAARRHPGVSFLMHHQAELTHRDTFPSLAWAEIAETAAIGNVHIKYSGFFSAGVAEWAFPHRETWSNARRLYQLFGSQRLHWGSDYPMCLRGVTYRQALEVVASQLDFLSDDDRSAILGDSLAQWLDLVPAT